MLRNIGGMIMRNAASITITRSGTIRIEKFDFSDGKT
jgi:hypothetical protein